LGSTAVDPRLGGCKGHDLSAGKPRKYRNTGYPILSLSLSHQYSRDDLLLWNLFIAQTRIVACRSRLLTGQGVTPNAGASPA